MSVPPSSGSGNEKLDELIAEYVRICESQGEEPGASYTEEFDAWRKLAWYLVDEALKARKDA